MSLRREKVANNMTEHTSASRDKKLRSQTALGRNYIKSVITAEGRVKDFQDLLDVESVVPLRLT